MNIRRYSGKAVFRMVIFPIIAVICFSVFCLGGSNFESLCMYCKVLFGFLNGLVIPVSIFR